MGRATDDVVLIDADGQAIGRHDRQSVHSEQTPRHLAMSCWIVDTDGSVLITRRALGKRTWPGVWTNSCCGHPRPDEPVESAVHRRVQEELGMTITEVTCVLPNFSYRAVDRSGVVENEWCPVYTATPADRFALDPDPSEVADWTWQPVAQVRAAVEAAPYAFSPWAVDQLAQLGPGGLSRDGRTAC